MKLLIYSPPEPICKPAFPTVWSVEQTLKLIVTHVFEEVLARGELASEEGLGGCGGGGGGGGAGDSLQRRRRRQGQAPLLLKPNPSPHNRHGDPSPLATTPSIFYPPSPRLSQLKDA